MARRPHIGHLRLLVHLSADPVTGIAVNHGKAVCFHVALHRMRDVAKMRAGTHCRYGFFQGLPGDIDQPPGQGLTRPTAKVDAVSL